MDQQTGSTVLKPKESTGAPDPTSGPLNTGSYSVYGQAWTGTRREEGAGDFSVKAGLRPTVAGAGDAGSRRWETAVRAAAQLRVLRAAARVSARARPAVPVTEADH